MFFLIVFYALVLLAVVFIVPTQIIIPTMRGEKWFPLFRAQRTKLEDEIAELKTQEVEEELKAARDALIAKREQNNQGDKAM